MWERKCPDKSGSIVIQSSVLQEDINQLQSQLEAQEDTLRNMKEEIDNREEQIMELRQQRDAALKASSNKLKQQNSHQGIHD